MAVDTRSAAPPVLREPGAEPRRRLVRPPLPVLLPVVFAALNGLAFYLIRPDVNDLWAAREAPWRLW